MQNVSAKSGQAIRTSRLRSASIATDASSDARPELALGENSRRLRPLHARMTAGAILGLCRIFTAIEPVRLEPHPENRPRVYFANHTSMGDFVALWSVFPKGMRRQIRPVAASDYWLTSGLKAFVIRDVFRAVLIDRCAASRSEDPVDLMTGALDQGASLILFPEGTRNNTGQSLLPFKTGLYHLAVKRPDIDLVPVWLHNINRVMPKGRVVPVPVNCDATFGRSIRLAKHESRDEFLARARQNLLKLAGEKGGLS